MQSDKKEVCLFIINTEFVLLVSLLYYFLALKNKVNVKPVFVFIKVSSFRFNNINFDFLPGDSYVYLNELNESVLFPDKKFLDVLKIKDVTHIVFQNPQAFTNQCIVNYFKKMNPNLRLTLVSDSIAIDRKILNTFKEKFIAYAKLYFRKYINRIPYLTNTIWTYHSYKYRPDELIAHRNFNYSTFYDTNDLFALIPSYIDELTKIFNINIEAYAKSDIIFFTQPNHLYTKYPTSVKEGYINGVKYLFQLAQKHKKLITVKVHPSENIDYYKSLANEYVVVDTNSNTPAEIIINGISGKKIVSYFSSISIYDIQKKNKHYWLYKTIGHKLPSNYEYEFITYIDSINDIEKIIFS